MSQEHGAIIRLVSMDRRNFFRHISSRTANAAFEHAQEKVEERAAHWIRPPFALPELDFLLVCTRCSDCIEACPHDVIFPLAARLGADVVNTPAMDLINRGCHLCEDWPCVQACEVAALKLPQIEEEPSLPFPRLAHVEIDTQTCLPYLGPECGVCVSACPIEGAISLQREKPVIDEEKCTGCTLCREACVLEPKAVLVATTSAQKN